MIRLIRRDGGFPPGGYPFQDPRTGKKFDGFENGGFNDQVRAIIRHRSVNPRLYPASEPKWLDYSDVALELEAYTCNRLGNDPLYCHAENTRMKPLARVNGFPVCPVCKETMLPRYCPSCRHKRLIGYRCPKCRTEANK